MTFVFAYSSWPFRTERADAPTPVLGPQKTIDIPRKHGNTKTRASFWQGDPKHLDCPYFLATPRAIVLAAGFGKHHAR